MVTVTIQHGDQSLIKVVDKKSFTIGRALDCDIPLNETLVSRVHLTVQLRNGRIWIEDKNSSNGTYVNEIRLEPGQPTSLSSTDRIQLGRSEYFLTIAAPHEESPAEIIKVPSEVPNLNNTVGPAVSEPLPEPNYQAPVAIAPVAVEPAPLDTNDPEIKVAVVKADKLLHEAKKKAAKIILEGEAQAEKKVQSIYEQARLTQEEAENFYQTRMSQARQESDALLADTQKQGQTLIHEARTMADSLRTEVETYVQTLREKTRKESDKLLADATAEAERMRAEAIARGKEAIREESEDILKKAKAEAESLRSKASSEVETLRKNVNEEVDRLVLNAEEDAARIKTEVQKEADALRKKYELEAQEFSRKSELQKKALDEAENKLSEQERKIVSLKAMFEKTQAEEHELKSANESARQTLASQQAALQSLETRLKAQDKEFEDKKKAQEQTLTSLQEKQAQMSLELQDIKTQKELAQKDFETHKNSIREKLDQEQQESAKKLEARSEELRLELAARTQKMERQVVDELMLQREGLIKEIFTSVEREVVKSLDSGKWRSLAATVEKNIGEALENKVSSLAQANLSSGKPVDLMKKKKQERARWLSLGLVTGMALFFGAQVLVQKIQNDQTPMQTLVTENAKERQAELERRKFNPPQTDELKETYTDAVIYTRNYTANYTDAQFQERFFKAASQYLLKTWRVDEDKSIQVVSASNALVKELEERKDKIHPDFVKSGLTKMRAFEKDTLKRIKGILGSEVRLDSYLRFERNFYKEEMRRKKVAQP